MSIKDDLDKVLQRMNAKAETVQRMRAQVQKAFRKMKKVPHCEIHPKEEKIFDEERSVQSSVGSGEPRFIWSLCPECIADAVLQNSNVFLSEAGVPKRMLHCSFGNFNRDQKDDAAACQMAEKFSVLHKDSGSDEALFLFFMGDIGCGKTHLAVAALRALGFGMFITASDMVAELRRSYQGDKTRIIQRCEARRLLVIDDIGEGFTGKDEQEMLRQILTKRYNDILPTILTTNMAQDAFKKLIGSRIVDRLSEGLMIVKMSGETKRKKRLTRSAK